MVQSPNAAVDQKAQGILRQMIGGYVATQLIHVAAQLAVSDHMSDGPRSSDDLAAATGAHAPSLHRALRGLAALGVLEEPEPRMFKLTGIGELLRSGAPGSMRGMAMFTGGEAGFKVWGSLLHTVKTGETTFNHVHGISGFEYFARNPEISKAFNARMAEGTRASIPGILAASDFARFGTIADIGGGNGTLLSAILVANPSVRGVLFDSATGLAEAAGVLKNAGVTDRCEVVTGDFFEAIAPGCEAYLFKHIIHDWTDDQCQQILANCRSVIPADGTLLLIEAVMPATMDRSPANASMAFGDINMLVNTGGRERTEEDFRTLLESAGFRLTRVIPVEAPWPLFLIEGVPA